MPQLQVRHRLSRVAAAFLRLVAVVGPAPLALLTALYVGRPSPYFLATGIALAVARGVRCLDHRASPLDHRNPRPGHPDCILALPGKLHALTASCTVGIVRPIAAGVSTGGDGDLRTANRGESS